MGVPPGGAGLCEARSLGLCRDMAAADGAAVEISIGLSSGIMRTPGSAGVLAWCLLIFDMEIFWLLPLCPMSLPMKTAHPSCARGALF